MCAARICVCKSERERERERQGEVERGAHADPRRGTGQPRGRGERGGERRWRYAAQPWEPTAARASRPPLSSPLLTSLLLFSFYRAGRACRLSLYRIGGQRNLFLLVGRRGPLLVAIPLVVSPARGRGSPEQERFPSFVLVRLDRLYRPVDFYPFFVGNRRYRCTSNTNAHMYGPRRIVPAGNRAFFRARFLADFIPIPRNKLAGDHGGICLPDDLFSPALFLPFILLICYSAMKEMVFFSPFRKVRASCVPASLRRERVLAAREKGGV